MVNFRKGYFKEYKKQNKKKHGDFCVNGLVLFLRDDVVFKYIFGFNLWLKYFCYSVTICCCAKLCCFTIQSHLK